MHALLAHMEQGTSGSMKIFRRKGTACVNKWAKPTDWFFSSYIILMGKQLLEASVNILS